MRAGSWSAVALTVVAMAACGTSIVDGDLVQDPLPMDPIDASSSTPASPTSPTDSGTGARDAGRGDAASPDASRADAGRPSDASADTWRVDAASEVGHSIQVSSGGGHTCALLDTGRVKCWGYNGHGQLGNGTKIDSTVPVDVSGISTAVAIAAGTVHTCALLSSGAAQCWGDNHYTQLGNGAAGVESSTPVAVSGGSASGVSLFAGNLTTCMRLSGGGVECWGNNSNGQIGDGTTTDRASATAVTGITTGTSALDTGLSHACALVSGAVSCWGNNYFGGLGDGTTTQRSTPVSVVGLAGTIQSTALARWRTIAGGGWHTCAILTTGAVQCWGHGNVGQLGNGTQTTQQMTPVSVTGLVDAVALSASSYHTCAIRSTGDLQCWGNNGRGEIGAGGGSFSTTPVSITGLGSPVTDVSAAGATFAKGSIGYSTGQTCAIIAGSVWCWGDNQFGQLGRGSTSSSSAPARVIGL